MRIPFTKLHGAKNDFLLTDVQDAPVEDLPEIAIAICDRYTGVGADGWMLIDRRSPAADASIRLFNSDGSEPELSGNGTRCAAALLAREHPEHREFSILTAAGLKHLRLLSSDDQEFAFEMNMGHIRVLETHAMVRGREAVIVDAGNPQCAFPVEDFDLDWRGLGAAVERDPRFPNRTNVSFFRVAGRLPEERHVIEVRFWERGAGETNSSGTGSTGAAIAAIARGLVESPVTVSTPAGELRLRVENGQAYLTGPAAVIAEGFYLYGKMKPHAQ